MASFGWEMNSTTWSAKEIRQVLETMEHNPFSRLVEMDPGGNEQWRPYDAELVVSLLQANDDLQIVTRSIPRYLGRFAISQFEATLSRYTQDHHVGVRIMTDAIEGEGMAKLLPFIHAVSGSLSQLIRVFTVVLDPNITQFYRANDLPELPKCLSGVLRWYYLLSPACYEQSYTAEVLLNAPAYSVRDVGNGMIEMICYESVLGYDTPEAQQQVIDLTRYLDAHRIR